MKKSLYLAFILILITNISDGQTNNLREIVDFNPGNLTEEQILYLKDSTKGIPSSYSGEERNHIAYGISNVGLSSLDSRIFIWWHSCDDMTESSIVILKTIDNKNYQQVIEKKNIPSNIHEPVLYCVNFINDTPFQNHFYLIYKKFENGSMAHVVTLVVPKQMPKNTLSKL